MRKVEINNTTGVTVARRSDGSVAVLYTNTQGVDVIEWFASESVVTFI